MEEEFPQENNTEEEDMTTEELAYDNHLAISGLVELLVQKGIISEEEYQAKLQQLDPDEDDEEEETESSQSESMPQFG